MRLLLCDDHRLFMQALGHALESQGHEVVATVTTPEEAVVLVRRDLPDVCVMDLTFPGGSGIEAVRQIVEHAPATKVLVLSGFVDAQTASSVLQAGANGLVGKDQPVDRILRALDQLGDGELAFDPALLRASVRRGAEAERTHRLIRQLTPRERQVLIRLVKAETTREIAEHMGITPSTARAYVQTILVKLGVHSRLQAVSLISRLDLVDRL